MGKSHHRNQKASVGFYKYRKLVARARFTAWNWWVALLSLFSSCEGDNPGATCMGSFICPLCPVLFMFWRRTKVDAYATPTGNSGCLASDACSVLPCGSESSNPPPHLARMGRTETRFSDFFCSRGCNRATSQA
ncbi:uncharacterized protein IWZ02DRAFT_69961 [Phyllosticta citriasiana]|uniref:uncharacterized protein n=1 Tax=Phyllosticta citriasiana TaxID=595635 RepID=UPI0030FDD2B0